MEEAALDVCDANLALGRDLARVLLPRALALRVDAEVVDSSDVERSRCADGSDGSMAAHGPARVGLCRFSVRTAASWGRGARGTRVWAGLDGSSLKTWWLPKKIVHGHGEERERENKHGMHGRRPNGRIPSYGGIYWIGLGMYIMHKLPCSAHGQAANTGTAQRSSPRA